MNTTATEIDGFNNNASDDNAVSIAVDGNTVHVVHSAKYNGYPDSYNLKYIEGEMRVENELLINWGTQEQLTSDNASIYMYSNRNPNIIVVNGVPTIVCSREHTSNTIKILKRNATLPYNTFNLNWTHNSVFVKDDVELFQEKPVALYVPPEINRLVNGELFLAWQGKRY